jgi:hypothetical protein
MKGPDKQSLYGRASSAALDNAETAEIFTRKVMAGICEPLLSKPGDDYIRIATRMLMPMCVFGQVEAFRVNTILDPDSGDQVFST